MKMVQVISTVGVHVDTDDNLPNAAYVACAEGEAAGSNKQLRKVCVPAFKAPTGATITETRYWTVDDEDPDEVVLQGPYEWEVTTYDAEVVTDA
jgi:hypothetical protein